MFQEKVFSVPAFHHIWKEQFAVLCLLKNSQHTNPAKKKKSKSYSHKETKPTMIFSHLHLTQSLGAFFLVWMLPQAPDILNLIGSLQCSLLQTTFFRPLESFSIYSAEYIRLSALESWCLQKIYLSSAGGTGCQFFLGVSSCSKEALCGLSTSHIWVDLLFCLLLYLDNDHTCCVWVERGVYCIISLLCD